MGSKISIMYEKQILELKQQGKPIRKIASVLGISRNTVRKYLNYKDTPAEPVGKGIVNKEPNSLKWFDLLNWDEIIRKKQSGYQFDALHKEYAPEGVSYWSFNRRLNQLLDSKANLVSIPQVHKPGEKTQVDYTDGLMITDPITGKLTKTHLFCGVLAYSGYCFGEFTLNQKQESFIRSHENMWIFFGGVTPYVVLDNLKSGVKKAHRYDPELNPTYCDFGNHCGFAGLPTRPYSPKDKGLVETTIGAIQRRFYQDNKERVFYSLYELNIEFKKFLSTFNNRIMKDYGVSRFERFQSEKDLLLDPPKNQYEIFTWKESKVHPDCHIQIEHCYYSTPFKFINKTVRVKISNKSVEIFDCSLNLIACHAKMTKKSSRSTLDGHLPSERVQSSQFEVKKALSIAKSIGPNMEKLMELIFDTPRPLTGLRRSQGMLRNLNKDGVCTKAMEYAAEKCINFNKIRNDFFKNCCKAYATSQNSAKNSSAPKRQTNSMYLSK